MWMHAGEMVMARTEDELTGLLNHRAAQCDDCDVFLGLTGSREEGFPGCSDQRYTQIIMIASAGFGEIKTE